MTNEEIKTSIVALNPAAILEDSGEWINIVIDSILWKPFALQLRTITTLDFDYLFCLTCIDWKTHFTLVMHLTSTTRRHTVVVKTKLDKDNPVADTVSDIWMTAEFHEREVYDLFGVRFTGHPDLRRILMPEEFTAFPLRKDYPLQGRGERHNFPVLERSEA